MVDCRPPTADRRPPTADRRLPSQRSAPLATAAYDPWGVPQAGMIACVRQIGTSRPIGEQSCYNACT
jgi:hypothetical protein